MHPTEAFAPPGWRARLELGFARRGAATRLVHRRHEGPLVVQKALHPEGEGVCHALLLHPPSGIAGGDELAIDLSVGAAAHALITTPGAGKWYRSAGAEASQRLALRVADDAVLEWLPQENILFDGALARMVQHFDLAARARLIAWDVLCLGRRAAGERFDRGRLRLLSEVRRDGRPVWREQADLHGGSPLLDAAAGLAGAPVCGIMLAAGAEVDDALLGRLREARPPSGDGGVTRLPDLVAARYLGDSAEAARGWFVALWQLLRPRFAGREAAAPRIWST